MYFSRLQMAVFAAGVGVVWLIASFLFAALGLTGNASKPTLNSMIAAIVPSQTVTVTLMPFPTTVPTVINTPLPTLTPTPAPPTDTPTPYILRTYGQIDGLGNTWEVQVWNGGGTTQKIVQTALPTTAPTRNPCSFLLSDHFTLTSRGSRYWFWTAKQGERLIVGVIIYGGGKPDGSIVRMFDSKGTDILENPLTDSATVQLRAPYADTFKWDVYSTWLSPQRTYDVNVSSCPY